MKVGIYARVSTKDRQEVENQLRQLREFAAMQGWTIYREYIDHETGKTDDRAEFQAMFRDASQRKFDVLLFWALDRLSREGVLETLQHVGEDAGGLEAGAFGEQTGERPDKERGVYEEDQGESDLQSDDAFAQADTVQAGSAALAVGIF